MLLASSVLLSCAHPSALWQALPRYEEASLALVELYQHMNMHQEAMEMAESARLANEEATVEDEDEQEERAEGGASGEAADRLSEIFSKLGMQR